MKIIKKLLNKKGFTLMELIVTIAIAAIVLTPITIMMTAALRSTVIVEQQMDATQSTQAVFIYINEDIRAHGVGSASLLNAPVNDVLKIDNRNYVLQNTNFVVQEYDPISGLLISEKILSEYVHAVTFTLAPDELLTVTLEIDKNLDGIVDNVFPYKFAVRK